MQQGSAGYGGPAGGGWRTSSRLPVKFSPRSLQVEPECVNTHAGANATVVSRSADQRGASVSRERHARAEIAFPTLATPGAGLTALDEGVDLERVARVVSIDLEPQRKLAPKAHACRQLAPRSVHRAKLAVAQDGASLEKTTCEPTCLGCSDPAELQGEHKRRGPRELALATTKCCSSPYGPLL